MVQERVQISELSIDERAAFDAVERDEEGNLVQHVYHPGIKAYHEPRARIDEHYVEPTAEEIERSEEAAEGRPARKSRRRG